MSGATVSAHVNASIPGTRRQRDAALVTLGREHGRVRDRLLALDRQIEQLALEAADPARHQLIQSLPGFGSVTAARLIGYLPEELLQAGSNRTAATRLQAFLGERISRAFRPSSFTTDSIMRLHLTDRA